MTFGKKPFFNSPQKVLNASDLNTMVRMLNRSIVGGDGILVQVFGDRIVIQLDRTPSSSVVSLFQFQSEDDDILTCVQQGTNTQSGIQEVIVGKSYLMQRSPFDGAVIDYGEDDPIGYVYSSFNTRVATSVPEESGESPVFELQKITPPYFQGEMILAVRQRTELVHNNEIVWYQDLNTAGRAWAAETGE